MTADPLTHDQQRLASAIRALGADPDDRPTRVRAHDAAQRLTLHEIRQVLDALPATVVDRADLRRWGPS